jgi:hypothetical protein
MVGTAEQQRTFVLGDPDNLWPQPRFGEWNADRKDKLEAKLCRLTCDGKVSLADTQREIAADWIVAYRKYIGAPRKSRAYNHHAIRRARV